MNNIQLFTTDVLEGYEIESYKGFVIANQVAGTGFLTDLTASFSDLFGGTSGAYRGEMNRLFEDVKENLEEQASALGGNAIIGVRLDFDNISAKSMSMFMVSMQGTVVKIKPIVKEHEKLTSENGLVTEELLTLECRKRAYIRKLEKKINLNVDDWKYVLSHNMPELADLLYEAYNRAFSMPLAEGAGEIKIAFPKYLSKLTYSQAVELLYNKEACLVQQIKDHYLFSAKHILEYAKQGKLDLVFELLQSDKRSYSKRDLEEMRELAQYLQNLPDKGKMEEVKSGLFSSGGMRFICECGKKNNKETEFCEDCGKNIKGITRAQKETIDSFVEKTELLEKLL